MRFFKKEPKKSERPIELAPGETPNFHFSQEEIAKMEAEGLSREQIQAKEKEVQDRQIADALAKKIEASQ
ncbi:MAG: hypothetical protein Q7S32_03160 [bacterium]|nr:hypothetical protein [bacterium]